MTENNHRTYLYVGLAGEGDNIGAGGLYRRADGDEEWHEITIGLPSEPQVRALLVHPENPAVIYAGTNLGPYRSDDRGEHWEALESPREGMDVWVAGVPSPRSQRHVRRLRAMCHISF